MDIISFNEAATANGRIEKFIKDPDSNSGIITVPKVIGAGESVTVPAGRVAVLPNVQVDGTLNVEGDVFIPSGATLSKVVETEGNQTIAGVKTFTSSPIVPTPTTGTQAVNKDYADTKQSKAEVAYDANTSSYTTSTLPSGSIIERGCNTFGEYVAFADGTLINMSNTYNFVSNLGGQYFYFPVAFKDTSYSMEITYLATGRSQITTFTYNPINRSYAHVFANIDGSLVVSYIAIGRWK